jgi:hypothetical protein
LEKKLEQGVSLTVDLSALNVTQYGVITA